MRAENLNGHIIALTGSVMAMMEDRDKIAATLAERDNQNKIVAQRRQKKLHELIDFEVSTQKPDGHVSTKARGMRASLERQRADIEAVKMILQSARTVEEEKQ